MKDTSCLKVLQIGPDIGVRGGVSSVEKLILSNVSDKIEISHLSTTYDGNRVLKIFSGLFSWIILPFKIIRHRPHLVHIHFASRGSTWRKIPLSLISRFFRKPVILHSHGAEFREFYLNECGRIRKLMIRRFLKKAKIVIALSHSWKSFFVEHCDILEEKIIVLTNPVDTRKLVPPSQKSHETELLGIVTNGRMGARKGTYDCIRAIDSLNNEIKKNIHYSLTGDGENEEVKKLITSMNLEPIIEVHGWLSDRDLLKIRKKAHVFLLPSYNEGLPMALIEAMSLGLVPIVTPVGGIPEVVKHMENGIIVKPGDSDEISNSLNVLFSDRNLLRELSINARLSSESFDITNYISNLELLYQDFMVH